MTVALRQRPAIDAVTDAVGFGYVRVPGADGKLSQFAHASSIEIATTDGKLAQYYLGVEYSPKDIMLGLVEASGNKIGSPVANILTYCYHYDPQTNKHSLIVARVVQVGGMITMAGLGGFMFLMFRRDLKLGRDHDLIVVEGAGVDRGGAGLCRQQRGRVGAVAVHEQHLRVADERDRAEQDERAHDGEHHQCLPILCACHVDR